HRFLTPVFGTACPPRGFSGLIRRYAYRFGESRLLHWALLMLADRVDVEESRLSTLARRRPDDVIAETGVRAELDRHGWGSRVRRGRADVIHQLPDAGRFIEPGTLASSARDLLVHHLLHFLARPRRRQGPSRGAAFESWRYHPDEPGPERSDE